MSATLASALWLALSPTYVRPATPAVPATSPDPSSLVDLRGDDTHVEQIERELVPDWSQRRKIGTNTTIFVNFDGVTLGECEPSNSKANCSSLNAGVEFPPWSGSWSTRVAILESMRARTRDFGIRITGVRPPDDEDYVMVVYGDADDAEEGDEILGRAPSGDCYDALPNQIAFAYLDGEQATWTDGGAATALHEAGHTWGLDHIDAAHAIMSPTGDNSNAYFTEDCFQIVENLELDPGGESCPELNFELCGEGDLQDDRALLQYLFGAPYVDDEAPVLELVSPDDGQYFAQPGTFRVDLEVHDDLHPQYYARALTIEGLAEYQFQEGLTDLDFDVVELPLGRWVFDVRVRDGAGNESSLQFEVEVGEEAVPAASSDEGGCACSPGRAGERGRGLPALAAALALAWRRRRR